MALKTVPFNVAFDFSRPAPADYEDINGDIQTAGVDEPRFNYSNGVAEGLILDASLSETAAINDIPTFNSSSGTWVFKGFLDKSLPIPSAGFGEFMEGSGTLVFVYSGGVGKCWADGEVLYTVDSFSAAEPEFLSNGGLAKIQSLKYYPYAWSEEKAAAESNGEFSIYYSPLFLFADGTDGYWGDSSDPATRFKDVAGTDPAAAAGDEFGLRLDKSGNGNNQYQATTAQKGTYQTDGTYHWVALDDDDNYLIDVPAGGWAGTYVQGTMQGVIVAEFAAPEGPYQIPTDPNYAGPGTDTQLVLVDRVLSDHELEGLVEWVGQRGAETDFAGAADGVDWFLFRDDLTALDASRWDVSAFGSLIRFVANCSNLASLKMDGWVPANVTSFMRFMTNCPLLTRLDVSSWRTVSANTFFRFAASSGLHELIIYGGTGNPFSDSPCVDYRAAFLDTNLSQQSYEDLVTAIESAGTSNGELDITGGSATTTGAAQTAVDALRARGWAVTTPDGY
ncbi:hypothetical protein [Alcanivorax sp. DP30]|uniref:hypothetical protein n=1 Tax=Alcanivorax sp. DP30 TaxID=2606217 RepID=UPI00137161C5|nr:hypothetical protein [Alcanivorax sp. DP30]MZR63869.1 hypothetical protein [Alcanivorax sp. DP30]